MVLLDSGLKNHNNMKSRKKQMPTSRRKKDLLTLATKKKRKIDHYKGEAESKRIFNLQKMKMNNNLNSM